MLTRLSFNELYSVLLILFQLNSPSNNGSKVFKIDFSIILIRGEVNAKGRILVDLSFFGILMYRILE